MIKNIIFLSVFSLILLWILFAAANLQANTNLSNRSHSPDAGEHFRPVEHDSSLSECMIYVPAYSHIYLMDSKPQAMGITLSIRNIDLTAPVIIKQIDYYNTAGLKIDSLLNQAHELDPQATISFVIDQRDMEGGSGASFMVHWSVQSSDSIVQRPLAEAVMAAITGNKAMSFSVRGVNLSNCAL